MVVVIGANPKSGSFKYVVLFGFCRKKCHKHDRSGVTLFFKIVFAITYNITYVDEQEMSI